MTPENLTLSELLSQLRTAEAAQKNLITMADNQKHAFYLLREKFERFPATENQKPAIQKHIKKLDRMILRLLRLTDSK